MNWKTSLKLAGLGLAGSGLAAGAGYYANRIERARVQLDRFTVRVDKSGLPPGGLTLLHLTDFHFRANDRVQEKRLGRLRAALSTVQYDMLILSGDLVHDTAGLPAALAFLSELRPRLAAFTVPGNRDYWESSFTAVLGSADQRRNLGVGARVRLLTGNVRSLLLTYIRNERGWMRVRANDVPAMHEALASQGIQPLVNCAVQVRQGDLDIWFAGVDDYTQGRPDLPGALREVPEGALLVLLAHNPDQWEAPLAGRADLVLSGHTHGGQLRFPVIGAPYRQGTHLDRRKAAGWFERDGSVLFVSRGLGESFPFRLGAVPQAALITLTPA